MSLFKTYTSDSCRIFEATETGGKGLGPVGEPKSTRTYTILEWRRLIAEGEKKRRKKVIKSKWEKLVLALLQG